MHKAKIILSDVEFEGTLDFYVIRKVQEELELQGFSSKVSDIFENISSIKKLDNISAHITINSILVNSITRLGKYIEQDIEDKYGLEKDPFTYFKNIFVYIDTLIKKCMPRDEEVEDDEYEVPDWYKEKNKKDWDFDDMEYMWYSMLKRTDDFYKITPKNFFKQIDIYKEINMPK